MNTQISLTNVLKPEVLLSIVSLIQSVVVTVEKTVKGTSEEKLEAAISLFLKAYETSDLVFDFPDIIDMLVKNVAPHLITAAVDLFNKTGVFQK